MSKPTTLPRDSSGFSLIEIITALSVASILLAIGVPSFQTLTQSSRMTGAINTIVSHLNLARSEAVKRGMDIVLCPSDDGIDCTSTMVWDKDIIMFADNNRNRQLDPGETLIRHINLNSDSIEITTTTGRRRAVYDFRGFSMGYNVSFTFCDTVNKVAPKAVIVSNSGRTRISDTKADGKPLDCS
jgi:type IV fimbrial biogenesis protein FimT